VRRRDSRSVAARPVDPARVQVWHVPRRIFLSGAAIPGSPSVRRSGIVSAVELNERGGNFRNSCKVRGVRSVPFARIVLRSAMTVAVDPLGCIHVPRPKSVVPRPSSVPGRAAQTRPAGGDRRAAGGVPIAPGCAEGSDTGRRRGPDRESARPIVGLPRSACRGRGLNPSARRGRRPARAAGSGHHGRACRRVRRRFGRRRSFHDRSPSGRDAGSCRIRECRGAHRPYPCPPHRGTRGLLVPMVVPSLGEHIPGRAPQRGALMA
jgi:hypothetical protein